METRKALYTMACIIFLASCINDTPSHDIKAGTVQIRDSFKSDNKKTRPMTFDSTRIPISDTSYKLDFPIFDTKSYDDEDLKNSIVSFIPVRPTYLLVNEFYMSR